MAGTYSPALLNTHMCACVCVHALIRVCPSQALLSPVLLFRVVISERKIIRCLIEGAGKGEEGEGVADMNLVASYHAVRVQSLYTHALTDIFASDMRQRDKTSE